MGVDLTVGLLAWYAATSPGDIQWVRDEFGRVNAALREAGVGAYREADDLGDWRFDSDFSTSNLRELRRMAAYMEVEGGLPERGEPWDAGEAVLGRFYHVTHLGDEWFYDLDRPDLSKAVRWFPNVLRHAAQGYYVPVEFDGVIEARAELEIDGGGVIGTSYGLLRECERLSEALQLPVGADKKRVGEIWYFLDEDPWVEARWFAGVGCVELMRACRASIEKSAAVVLH